MNISAQSPLLSRIRDVGKTHLQAGSRMFLYGSRARGDFRPDSDWDILVLLNKPKIEQADYDGICYELTSLGWELDEMIIPVPYTIDEWEQYSFSPFYKNVLSDKIEIL